MVVDIWLLFYVFVGCVCGLLCFFVILVICFVCC